MDWLFSIYIAATIFGVGVTIVDMFGILGDLVHHASEGADSGDHDGGHHGDHHVDHDAAHHADGHDNSHDLDHTGDQDGGHHGDHHESHDHVAEHEAKDLVWVHETERDFNILPRVLLIIRSFVYFSLGFGPVGVFALATGESHLASAAWSVPVGTIALIGARLLRRIQRQELDSQITIEEMIMQNGQVLVSIGQGQLGKVRVNLDGIYVDRYARAQDPQKSLPVGTTVRVVDVSEECIYVEEE